MRDAKLKKFIHNESGSFAILAAAAMMMLLTVSAVAIDVTRMMQYKRLLADAADNAVLAAVSEGSRSRKYAENFVGNGPIPPGAEDVDSLFRVNFIDQKQADFQYVRVNADAHRKDGKIESFLDYEVKVKTFFGKLLGVDTITYAGSSSAAWLEPKPIDYFLLLDNTPSMGIGATRQDIRILENDPVMTKVSGAICAFACHISGAGNDGRNTLPIARELGVTLRTDVVREAATRLISTAQQHQQFPGQFRFAAYTFGANHADAKLTAIAELSANYGEIQSGLQKYQLMEIKNGAPGVGVQTNFEPVFSDISTEINSSQRGSGIEDREKFVFFVSDGLVGAYLNDYPNCKKTPWAEVICREPIDPSVCSKLKAKGIKIAALYTTYLDDLNDEWVRNYYSKWSHEMPESMKACASPGLFFEVGPDQGIAEAMIELFKKSLDKPHLTKAKS